jgi:peptidyl-prolyl cis-trans isomerase SurA
MNLRASIPLLCLALAAVALPAQTQAAPAQTAPAQPPPQPAPPALPGAVELDHVVAVIGASVILESDVVQEMHLSALEPLQVLPGQNTPATALRRLIDRTLILDQMREQQQPIDTPLPEVREAVADLRKSIPACEQDRCNTEAKWDYFLRTNGLNPEMVEERWSQRMAILRFIDLRFRSGIHIAPDQISAYYQKTLVPALAKDHQTAPPLADVSTRIQEILLQQQVTGLFQDWLFSLRDQGNVRIVDEAYSADLDATSKSAAGDQSQ